METTARRNKWNIVRYIGPVLPKLSGLQNCIIRKQLTERYCHLCGEYIYNPYHNRQVKHYHHLKYHYKYTPLFEKRVLIHPQSQLVEWTRRFHKVLRLLITESDIIFYKGMKPQFTRRIPSIRMWTINEWNDIHPNIRIFKTDGMTKFTKQSYHNDIDTFWIPDLYYNHT